MRRNATALLAAAALAATLTACGGTGGNGTVTDIKTSTSTDVTNDATTEDTKGEEETAKPSTANITDDEKADAQAKAKEAGKTVLTGIVVMIDGPDIFDYEDVDPKLLGDEHSEDGNTYAILELDEKTHIVGEGADGSPREDDDDHVGLGDDMPKYDFTEDTASQWKQYEGKRICVAGHAWFPTDVSFPMSARMSDAEVLYEE